MSTSSSHAVRVTYIWLAGKNAHHDIRSKDRTLYLTKEQLQLEPKQLLATGCFPVWNFDGSSTGQATGPDTEILLHPVNAYPCCLPRHTQSNLPWIVVLAECYYPNGKPTSDNSRAVARKIFEQLPEEKPWFGMEQEFFLTRNNRPVGWPDRGFPAPQGPYYCSTGANVAFGRKYLDMMYETCLQMGIKVSGTNAEVTPGQWEFQVGPCEGIEMGDQLTVARWVLLRILEEDGLDVDYRAKPVEGDWNGSGMHTNFSTVSTRGKDGLDVIHQYIERMQKTVPKDIIFYGPENDKRLTGKHETSKATEFASGVGTRTTSIRIPNSVASERCGYMEDRRPAGDADPYLVSSRLFASAVGLEDEELVLCSPTHQQKWMTEAFGPAQ
eukprot:gene1158-683_t